MVKGLMFFLVFMLFSTPLSADKIVVWNLKPQTGVTEKESVTVTSILTSEIERVSKKTVVSEAEMKSVIDGETMRIACGADDNVCIAEIGAAMGAPFSVSGILSKMGDYWVITLQLVDIRKVETVSRINERFKGDMNSLVESLTPLVYKLFDEEPSISSDPGKEEKVKKEREAASWQKIAGWTFTTVGVLSLGGGIVSNVMMNSARDEFIKSGKSGDEDKFKMFRGLTIGGYVAGSVFIAGGITLLVLDAVSPERKNENVSFYFVPSGDGFVTGLQGRW